MLLTYDPAARRLGIAFATFVISIGFAGVVSATEGCNAIGYDNRFSDVWGCHPYYPAISWLYKKGIVEGTADASVREGTRAFLPERTINRAEFAKILLRASNVPASLSDCREKPFMDVELSTWYAPYVCTAKARGMVSGYPNGTFKPSQSVSFVEAAKMLAVNFGLPVNQKEARWDLSGQEQQVWYLPYTYALARKDALAPSIFTYDQRITRGEMAEIVYRLSTDTTSHATVDPLSGVIGPSGADRTYNMLSSIEPAMINILGSPLDDSLIAFSHTQSLEYILGWKQNATGIRIVHALPQQRCTESGLPEHCQPLTRNIDVGFYILGKGSGTVHQALIKSNYDNFVDRTAGTRKKITVSCLNVGIEGEYTEYCIMPITAQKTLLIVRDWIDTSVCCDNITSYKTDEQERIFQGLLDSLDLLVEPVASDMIAVKLYFGDKKVIEESDCAATKPVARYIPKTSAVADATLRLLLQGVTPEIGEAQGLVSSFDNKTGYFGENIESLLSYYHGITIVNGVATLKFSGEAMAYLNNTACTQEAVKGSIGDTLLQFPSIKKIQYSIDGKVITDWDG